MTRFARAKGSKASNEKKPEEATSWLEMKNSMLSKTKIKPEEPVDIKSFKKPPEEPTQWASLGDEFSNSISLIKQHLKKGNEKKIDYSQNNKIGKKKKKIKNVNNEDEKGESNFNTECDNFKKKKKKSNKVDVTNNVDVSVPEEVSKQKKKKNKKGKPEGNLVSGIENVEKNSKKRKILTEDNSDISIKKKKISENAAEAERNEKVVKNENKKNRFNTKDINSPSNKKSKGKFSKDKRKEKFQKKTSNDVVEELIINGEKVPIVKFQGFYITLEDAERLKKLRMEMKKEGIPKAKSEAAIKLERRRAEKALSRLKKSVCFHCRERGHLLSNCPNLVEKESTGTGICYKCGSTEHSAFDCKVVKGTNFQFAECFICKEQGHIARQCPDNPRGLYPQGGACRECGDVTHLRKDCPQVQAHKSEEVMTVGLRNDRNLECLDEELSTREKQTVKKKVKRSVNF